MATTVTLGNERGNLWLWYGLALAVIVLDQFTKYIATALLDYNAPIPVLPVLDWTLLHNPGAAWSFLSDAGGWQRWFFIALSGTVSVVIAVWIARLPRLQWLLAGACVTVMPILLIGIFARLALKMNFMDLSGLLAGSMTDPPALAFASNVAGSDGPTVAYATVFPLTTLLRILSAQLLAIILFS